MIGSRTLAEAEAVTDAARIADVLADSVVQPALVDGVITGDTAAIRLLDTGVRDHVLDPTIVRVKLWSPTGEILYSDEQRLIGQRFELDEEEREVFADPQTRAEVSDLDAPENLYERGGGPLLEVYRPVWTDTGRPMLFELYFRYDDVTARSGQLWRGFAGVSLTSLLLVVLLIPVVWRLLARLRQEQGQREILLQKTVDASAAERRRIAGTLHDGVVQDLVGVSYLLSGTADRAAGTGRSDLADDLHEVSGQVRSSIGGLRSLLVDIYPPSLATAGLRAALDDLAITLRSRTITVETVVPDESGLDADGDRLVYRVAQECLTNIVRHSGASSARLTVSVGARTTVLEIVDDGAGFDLRRTLAEPPPGHFGLRVMADTVREAGARLEASSAVGHGAAWKLTVPR